MSSVCLLFHGSPAEAKDAFRLRVCNTLWGAVEASADEGKNWTAVGRVLRPAAQVQSGEGKYPSPAIIRAGKHGFAMGWGAGKQVSVIPDTLSGRKNRSAIIVNIPSSAAFFTDLLPAVGASIQRIMSKVPLNIPDDYIPHDGDTLLIISSSSAVAPGREAEAALKAGNEYNALALDRWKARGKEPVNGVLTVTARLAPKDPDPQAVIFLVDGSNVAFTNRKPYTVSWNTRQWSNGEHLIEIRAMATGGGLLSSTKYPVITRN